MKSFTNKIWIKYSLLFCCLIYFIGNASAEGQDIRIVVFNTEGRIIKSFGDQNGYIFKNDLNKNIEKKKRSEKMTSTNLYRFIVENVPEVDKNKYFVRYQYRKNDYVHESNLLNVKDSVVKMCYNVRYKYTYLDIPVSSPDDEAIINYQLIKTNEWGSECDNLKNMSHSTNWANFYAKSLVKLFENELNSQNISSIKNKISGQKSAIKTVKANIETDKSTLKKETEKFADKKDSLQKEIDIYTTAIERLSQLDQAYNVVDRINILNDSLIKKHLELINIERKETNRLAQLNGKIAKTEKHLNDTLKKNYFDVDILDDDKLKSPLKFIYEPVYLILHQGTLVYTNERTKEIIYEYSSSEYEGTTRTNLTFIRQTPEYPTLTTDDVLYAKIINAKPDDLNKNRFYAKLNVDVSEKGTELEIINGTPVKGIEDIGIDFPEIPIVLSSKEGDSSKKSQIENRITKTSANDWANSVFCVDTLDSTKIKMLLEEYEQNQLDYGKKDSVFINYKVLLAKEYLDELNKNLQPDKQDSEFKVVKKYINEVIKEKNQNKQPEYVDYLLKYPNILPYLSKPKVELYADTYYSEDFKISIKEGKEEKLTYTLKKDFKKVTSDQLPIVRKKYRFALTAGVAYTTLRKYKYTEQLISGTQDQYYLEEEKFCDHKFVPTLFLSTYIKKTDVYDPNRTFLERLHVDVGIDYADTDILDNFYIGAGCEPWRNFHLSLGTRIGEVERIDLSKVKPYTLDTSNAKYSKFKPGFYFAVNLGFNLIPTAIQSLINPAK